MYMVTKGTIYLFNGQKFTTEWTIQKSISNIKK